MRTRRGREYCSASSAFTPLICLYPSSLRSVNFSSCTGAVKHANSIPDPHSEKPAYRELAIKIYSVPGPARSVVGICSPERNYALRLRF